jgi:hypothetical protein
MDRDDKATQTEPENEVEVLRKALVDTIEENDKVSRTLLTLQLIAKVTRLERRLCEQNAEIDKKEKAILELAHLLGITEI